MSGEASRGGLHGLVKRAPVSLPTHPKRGGNRANGPFGERTTRFSRFFVT